jgi:hypothetical protein
MEVAERFALRDILAMACSMKPIGGVNPGLMTDTHFFWFYPDRIVQVETGGGLSKTIDYTDDVKGTFLAFVQATSVKTLTIAELVERNLFQQIAELFKQEENRRQQEAEQLRLNKPPYRNLRRIVFEDE